jgi:hypothetical protein
MQLTTLVEILEREIGVSTSARSELARMVAEREEKKRVVPATPRAAETPDRRRRSRSAG